LLEVDNESVAAAYRLTLVENIGALLVFKDLQNDDTFHLRFDLFEDMRLMLLGRDENTTCIWNGCDPYTTKAVRGIEGNGERTNCGRMNKEGIEFEKTDDPGAERYLALYQTPQEHGGCRGCRFFLMCKGNCPGTAIDHDWRNKTEYCEVWKHLYECIETELIEKGVVPLSQSGERVRIERLLLAAWARGQSLPIAEAVRRSRGGGGQGASR
jgi:uncharacterized protein